MTSIRGLEAAVSLSLQCGLLVGVGAILQTRFRSDRARDALWSACCLGVLMLAALPFTVPHLRLVRFPLSWFPVDGVWEALVTNAARVGLFVWLGGAAVALVRLILGIGRASRLVAHSRPLSLDEQDALDAALRTTHACPRLEQPVSYRVSDETLSPFCWQIHEPVVIVTEPILAFPPDELAAILRHELAHLCERHPLQLFLQRLASVALWFHPSVRWCLKQALRCREFVCDRAAAGNRQETAAYFRSLLRLAQFRMQSGAAELRLALLDRGTKIDERIQRLKSPPTPERRGALVAARLLPVALACVFALTIWAPLDPTASPRSKWSPWPKFTSRILQAAGVKVRDYEIDGHRVLPHERHHPHRPRPQAN